MKRSTVWFLVILGILLLFAVTGSLFLLAVFTSVSEEETEVVSGSGDKIAVVDLTGTILQSDNVVRQIKKYREDRSIKGILLHVDSPGGGVVASQEIYEEVKRTRESSKPIVVSMGALAASGGYYVSCPANRIVANPGTLTGSIGVISQFMHFDPLMEKIGIGVNTIKSGKFKDAGNPYREMTPDDRAYFQGMMDEVHRQFIAVVEENRRLDHDTVVKYADGRVFTGEQAVALGLVDTIGSYEDAVRITAGLAGIHGEPSIVKEKKRRQTLLDFLFGDVKVDDLIGVKDKLLNQPILQYRMAQAF